MQKEEESGMFSFTFNMSKPLYLRKIYGSVVMDANGDIYRLTKHYCKSEPLVMTCFGIPERTGSRLWTHVNMYRIDCVFNINRKGYQKSKIFKIVR